MTIGTPVEVGSAEWLTGSTITYAVTAAVPTGSIFVIYSNVLASGGVQIPITGITDLQGNTYAVGNAQGQDMGPEDTEIWYGIINSGLAISAALTITYSAAPSRGIVAGSYITGLDTTTPLDKHVGAVGNSTAPSSGSSGTLAQTDEICFGVVGRYNAASTVTLTSIGSFTALTKQQNASGTTRCTLWPAYQIVAATTAQTYAGTLSVSGRWEASVITLKGAAAAVDRPRFSRQLMQRPSAHTARARYGR